MNTYHLETIQGDLIPFIAIHAPNGDVIELFHSTRTAQRRLDYLNRELRVK